MFAQRIQFYICNAKLSNFICFMLVMFIAFRACIKEDRPSFRVFSRSIFHYIAFLLLLTSLRQKVGIGCRFCSGNRIVFSGREEGQEAEGRDMVPGVIS